MTERRICILGGCGGIGRGVVSACLANGDDVAVLDLKTSLARHPPPAGVLAVEIDGSDEASVTNAFAKVAERWTALDGFVNAAGFLIALRPLAQTPTHEFDTTIEGNVRTAFLCCKAAMTPSGKGRGAEPGQSGFRPRRLYPAQLWPLRCLEGSDHRADQDAGARTRTARARQRRCSRSRRHGFLARGYRTLRRTQFFVLSISPPTARRYHCAA